MSWIRRLGRLVGIGRRRWIEDAAVREEHSELVRGRLEEGRAADAARARRGSVPRDQLAIPKDHEGDETNPPSRDE